MLFSRRDLVKIILPLIIQQAFAVTIGLADGMMVSSAGEAAVSGVSLVSSLDLLLIYTFGALASGGAIVVSQFLGNNDLDLARSAAKQLIYACTFVALIVTTTVIAFRYPLLNALFGKTDAEVMKNAQSYFFFAALSFPFLAIYDAGAATFRAMGNSMISMTTSFAMNIINVAGNAILIYGFKMGATGAAIATLFSRAVGAVIITVLLHNKKNAIYIEKLLSFRPNFTIIKSILRVGIPNGIENSMFQFGKLLTQTVISALGTATIAANAVANTLVSFQYMPGTAIGLAMITVVGRCVGAEQKEQAKKYSRILIGTTYAALWLVILIMMIFAKPIIGVYDLSAESSALAYKLMLYHSICAALIWPLGFTLPNALRAASDVKFTLIVSVFSMWVFRVALGYYMALETVNVFGLFSFGGLGLGAMGVWIAMTVDWVFRVVFFLIRYLTGKWLTVYKPIKKS